MIRAFSFVAMVTLALQGAGVCAGPWQERRILGYGWDLLAATPEVVLANAEAFDSSGLDGVFAEIRFKAGGKTFSSQTVANDAPWPRAELERQMLPSLREFPNHRGLRESLVGAWFMPQKRLGWNDDAAWARFVGNMGELARLSYSAGLKGLFIDTEDYAHQGQFSYRPGDDAPSYDEAANLARERGREMAKAVFGEHPSAVLLATWFLSLRQGYALVEDVEGALRSGDLWPAFLNGMLDAAPPTARFVDGCETGYGLDAERNEFLLEAFRMRRGVERLVSPANRARFSEPFWSGFGMYLDMYVNPPGEAYHFGPAADGSRLTAFRHNLRQAMDCASSGYVWVYGEKHSFVSWKSVPEKLGAFQWRWGEKLRKNVGRWEDALPGLAQVLRVEKGGESALRDVVRRMRERHAFTNMLSNGSCRVDARCSAALPKGFWDWTAPGSPKNVFSADAMGGCGASGCIVAKGPANGVVCADAHVGAGDMIYASFRVRGDGASGSLAFKRNGKFVWKWPRVLLVFGEPDAEGWRRGEAFAQVPDGSDKAVLMGSVNLAAGGEVRFDDFEVAAVAIVGR